MTSVPQLPVESAPAKALPQGETPRGPAHKAGEEGRIDGFAALLAQALTELPQPAKAERTGEGKNLRVEGEDVSAEDGEATVAADAGQAEKPGVSVKTVQAAGPTLVDQAAPVVAELQLQQVAVETPPQAGPQLVAPTETEAHRTAAIPAEQSVEDETSPEAERVETNDAPVRQDAAARRERPVEVPKLAAATDRPAEDVQEERRRAERPRAVEPAPVEWQSAAAARVEQPPASQAVPAQTEQGPRAQSTPTEMRDAPQEPRAQPAAEPRRMIGTADASKTTPPTGGAPVIEFQVRQESASQQVRPQPQTADWVRAVEREAAKEQPKTTPRTEPAAAQPKAAEKEVLAAAAAAHDADPVRPSDIRQAPVRAVEHSDARRPVTQTVAAAPQSEQGQDDAKAGRGSSGDANDTRDESVERKATPNPKDISAKSIVADVSVDTQAETDKTQQVPLKAAAAATPVALPANAPQMTAQASSAPLLVANDRPLEEARPVAPASPPSEPEIAAKLQQQSGRTTLNVVLQDERLGRVALQLVERGGWIETAIRASDPRTAQTLSHGAAGLFEALQQRGLTLAAGGGASAWDAQQGQRRDNPQRDQESQRRRFRLRRAGGEFEGALARAEV